MLSKIHIISGIPLNLINDNVKSVVHLLNTVLKYNTQTQIHVCHDFEFPFNTVSVYSSVVLKYSNAVPNCEP